MKRIAFLLTIFVMSFFVSTMAVYAETPFTFGSTTALAKFEKYSMEFYAAELDSAIERLESPFVFSIDKGYKSIEKQLNDAFSYVMKTGKLREFSYSVSYTAYETTLTVKFGFSDSHAIIKAYENEKLLPRLTVKQKAVIEKAKKIVDAIIKPNMTDYEKELALHDYLVLNCEYHSESFISGNREKYPNAGDAYGALIDKKAVCQGYAEAMKLLLNMCGIECYILASDVHAWNLVKIDGEYYHLDATWDDPTPDQKGKVSYSFFNVTDDKISKVDQHNWTNKELFPAAKGTKYNYYIYNGMTVTSWEKAEERILKAKTDGKSSITLYLDGFKNFNIDYAALVQKLRVGISYSAPSADNPILTITFE